MSQAPLDGLGVPPEIEDYLIGLYARAGQLGGSIGGIAAGAVGGPGAAAAAGSRGGARGGARGAAMLKTKVESHSGEARGTPAEITARLAAAFPKAVPLPAADRVRIAVPLGLTGLQQIVIDLMFGSALDGTDRPRVLITLCGYGKEGILNRKPTRTVTDRAWAAVTAAS
jgi:hypothetical protein